MRVLFLTQYYPPESGACQNRIGYFARALSRSGHKVTVLTAMPNYPQGRIFGDYRGKLISSERDQSVAVIRTWMYASARHDFARRLLSYWSFVLISLMVGILRTGAQDVVITESPPLFLGITGLLLSSFKKAQHVLNVSDLWPESAVAMGVIGKGVLLKAAVALEEFLYRHSDLITGQTQAIVGDIASRSKGVRVELVTNGVDLDEFCQPEPSRASVRSELGIGDEFIVGYFGLHGLGQGLDAVLESARQLQHRRDVVFIFMGDGPQKAGLKRIAKAWQLRNVGFYDSQPAARMPAIYGAVDASVVPLRNLPLFRGALPSKLFTAMGAGLPVIAATDGEARDVVLGAHAGICVEPQNAAAIAQAVQRLADDPGLCRQLGENGAAFVRRYYDRQQIAAKLEGLLADLATCTRVSTFINEQPDICK